MPSLTLSLYIARRFLVSILLTQLGLLLVVGLIEIVDFLRRVDNRELSFGLIAEMDTLKTLGLFQQLLPFAVIIGSLIALTRLTRSQELVVARSAGVSVWQFLAPALAVAALLGIAMSTVISPITAALLLKYEKLETKYLSDTPNLLTVSATGLWLRQVESTADAEEHIIHAQRISQHDLSFSGVIVYTFDKNGRFLERLDAASAALEPGHLRLNQVMRSLPGQPSAALPEYLLPTTLQIEHIQDSFAAPETVSFWNLPAFITMLEDAGFSGLRHRLYFHSLLAAPFLYCGLLLIAAIFSLRLPRLGRIGQFVAAGLLSGFLLHFFTNVVNAFGMSGSLPIALAAWAPSAIIMMLGAGTLLHQEDG